MGYLFFMNNNFIKYLQNLTNDRFTLADLDHDEYSTFYALLLATFTGLGSQQIIHTSNPATDWYLLGTDGCHLCHASHTLLTQVQAMYPYTPTVHVLDLADSEKLIDHLGTLIPILITPTRLLCYPFVIMDIIYLLPNNHHK